MNDFCLVFPYFKSWKWLFQRLLNNGWGTFQGHFLSSKANGLKGLHPVSLFDSSFFVWLSFSFLVLFFLGHLFLSYVFLSSTASCLRVFPLLPVLCQQLGTLENVWHWPPPTIDSWWSQWRCWSSWSLPSMLLLKVLNMCVTVNIVQAALWSYFLVSSFSLS